MNETIAVVIPTCNRPEQTLNAIQSALAQSYPVTRILVVDDGSTDENYKKLCELIPEDRVELISISATRHPGRARNAAVNQVKEKWIAFLDSDDSWARDKIEKQIIGLLKSNHLASCTNAVAKNTPHGAKYYYVAFPKKITFRRLKKQNCIINSSVLVSRELLTKTNGVANSYSVRGVEDYATWLRIAKIAKWQYVDEPLVIYSSQSQDSVRIDEEFRQSQNSMLAIMDYADWLPIIGLRGAIYRFLFRLIKLVVG